MLPIGNIGNGGPVLPINEAQTRPLTKLSDPELQRAAWIHAVKSAPDGRVTAAHVKSVVREMLPPDPPKEPKPKPAPGPAAEQVIEGEAEPVNEPPPVPPEPPRLHPPSATLPVEPGTGGVTLPEDPPGPRPTKIEIGEMPNQLVMTRLKSGKIRLDTFYNAELDPQQIINALCQMLGRGEMIAMVFKAAPAPGDEFKPGEPRPYKTPSSGSDTSGGPHVSDEQAADEGVTSHENIAPSPGDKRANSGSESYVHATPDEGASSTQLENTGDSDEPATESPASGEIEIPEVFESPEAAWRWAVKLGAYSDIRQARRAYNKIKFRDDPQSAREMARLWIHEVAQWVPEMRELQEAR